MIKTVGNLIDALSRFDRSAPVVGTWESTIEELSVYATPSGVVLVDADASAYREQFESGRMVPDLSHRDVDQDPADVTLYGHSGLDADGKLKEIKR